MFAALPSGQGSGGVYVHSGASHGGASRMQPPRERVRLGDLDRDATTGMGMSMSGRRGRGGASGAAHSSGTGVVPREQLWGEPSHAGGDEWTRSRNDGAGDGRRRRGERRNSGAFASAAQQSLGASHGGATGRGGGNAWGPSRGGGSQERSGGSGTSGGRNRRRSSGALGDAVAAVWGSGVEAQTGDPAPRATAQQPRYQAQLWEGED